MSDNIILEEKAPSSGSVIIQHQTEQYPLFSTTMYTEEVCPYENGSLTPNEDEETHKQMINNPQNDNSENKNKLENCHFQTSDGTGLDLTAVPTSKFQENDVLSVDKLKNGSYNIIQFKKISSPSLLPPQSQLSPSTPVSSPEVARECEELHNPSSLSPVSNEEIVVERNISPTNWHMPKIQREYTQDLEHQQQEDGESENHQHQQNLIFGHRTRPPNAYGMLRNENEILFITESCIEIGRNSSTSMVHFHVAKNSFVSRKHFQVVLDQNSVNFYLICLSKNGVFVDNVFQRRNADPFLLPKSCTFRFPSTEIRILFESFINSSKSFNNDYNYTNSLKSSIENSKIIYAPLKISIPKNEQKSPYPSPTGTMSAANSCPTSPRQGFQDYQNYNNYINNNNNSQDQDLFHPPSTSNDLEKPPYSYAQLIVQAISAAPERQLTLSGIYSFISQNYPYYRKEANKGWQNSIRHNLSLNRYFIKVARSQDEPGKGSFWRIEPTSEAKLIDQSFKKRRQRNNQCFRPPFDMSRSAPVSPTHMDSSHSPENEIELQSAPVSPGGTYQYNHSSEEIVETGGSTQNMEQSACTYNQYNNYQNHINNNKTGQIVGNGNLASQKRHYQQQSSTATSAWGPGVSSRHVEIYDEMQDNNYGIDSSDECDNSSNKRQKFNCSEAER